MADQKMVELGRRCGECGAGIIRLTEKQRNSLKMAIAALRQEGFVVQLVRMYQAEPVMMVMMITPPTSPQPSPIANAAIGEGVDLR